MNSIRRVSGPGEPFSAKPEGIKKKSKKITETGLSALSNLKKSNAFVEATDKLEEPFKNHIYTHLTKYPFNKELTL